MATNAEITARNKRRATPIPPFVDPAPPDFTPQPLLPLPKSTGSSPFGPISALDQAAAVSQQRVADERLASTPAPDRNAALDMHLAAARKRGDIPTSKTIQSNEAVAKQGLTTRFFTPSNLALEAGRTAQGIPLQAPAQNVIQEPQRQRRIPGAHGLAVAMLTNNTQGLQGSANRKVAEMQGGRLAVKGARTGQDFEPARRGSAFGKRELSKRDPREDLGPIDIARLETMELQKQQIQQEIDSAPSKEARAVASSRMDLLNVQSSIMSREQSQFRADTLAENTLETGKSMRDTRAAQLLTAETKLHQREQDFDLKERKFAAQQDKTQLGQFNKDRDFQLRLDKLNQGNRQKNKKEQFSNGAVLDRQSLIGSFYDDLARLNNVSEDIITDPDNPSRNRAIQSVSGTLETQLQSLATEQGPEASNSAMYWWAQIMKVVSTQGDLTGHEDLQQKLLELGTPIEDGGFGITAGLEDLL